MERQRTGHREGTGPPPGTPSFAGNAGGEASGGTAMVSHGPYMERLPVDRMTVGEIRARFCDRLDIDPASQAVIDGQEVDENTVVEVGQLLTFVRRAGEKGLPGVPADALHRCVTS